MRVESRIALGFHVDRIFCGKPASLSGKCSSGARFGRCMSPYPSNGRLVELTVVIPTFNEKDNVGLLVERLHTTLAGIAWEAIFVDDDSATAHPMWSGRSPSVTGRSG